MGKRTHVDYWETVAVIPLPCGWVNRYKDGEEEYTTQCPALLLQERRSTTTTWEEGGSDVERYDAPFETRVVASEFDNGQLVDATDVSNYVGCIWRPDGEDWSHDGC